VKHLKLLSLTTKKTSSEILWFVPSSGFAPPSGLPRGTREDDFVFLADQSTECLFDFAASVGYGRL
jgi:hypothetical protein